MEVCTLSSSSPIYEDFIQQSASARLCHTFTWTDMVEKAFGYKGYNLVACENGQVCGVLPLTHVRSRLFGSRLVSQPFSDYGGPVTTSPAALKTLYNRAIEIATQCRCRTIELRNTVPLPYELHMRTDKISMYLPLAPDPQDVWKELRHKTRNRVRKAQKSGLIVTSGGEELLNEFYRIWTVRMRELGTPCYPRRLFNCIINAFPNAVRIFRVTLHDKTIAVLFAYTFKGWVQCSWGAALRGYDSLGPNYILNWSAMEYYCKEGMKWFDFGRSTIGSGQHTFKQRWGAHPISLCWQYWTQPGHELSIANPNNPKYKSRIKTWKKLPLSITRLVGPHISRSLP
ncbi:FemAB family XrtA/PEP-CTERM system-associated protein [Planctomycetota bacterium]